MGMIFFGEGVATPILFSISSKKYTYYGRKLVGIDIIKRF